MKKFTYLFVFAAFSFSTQAKKFRIGPALGLNLSRPTQKENVSTIGLSKATGTGAALGGRALFEVADQFLVDTGLYFAQRTAKHTYPGAVSIETSFTSLEIPVVTNWKFSQKPNHFYYFGLGFNNAYGVGDIDEKAIVLGESGSASGSYDAANMKRYMLGFLMTSGLVFQVSEKMDLGLDFRFLYELTKREKGSVKGYNVWSFDVIASLLW